MNKEVNLEKRKKVFNFIYMVGGIVSVFAFFKFDYVKNLFSNDKKEVKCDLKIKYDDQGNIIEIDNGLRVDYFFEGKKIKSKDL